VALQGGEVKRTFILQPLPHPSRGNAIQAIREADDGMKMTIAEQTRTADQNAKFHALCGDLEKSSLTWAGKRRKLAEWKVLLVSGHATATKEGSEIVPGIEGEFVNIRESTATMGKKRGASLLTYSIAFCDMQGVKLSEPKVLE
jgi:hypothetical protein